MWKVTLEDEYKKNPKLKGEDIQEVQVWLKKQPHLPSVTGKATQHFQGWAYIILFYLKNLFARGLNSTVSHFDVDSLNSSRQNETMSFVTKTFTLL